MAVDTSTKLEGSWGVTQGSAWLSTGETGAPSGVRSGSEAQGWNDACVAAVLFNVECNDSYVAAFLLNLRSGSRA
jgi:hypothetical protein